MRHQHLPVDAPVADPDTAPGPAAPHDYPRRVLLAVTGLSPQVVTETLYALACSSDPAFVPTEIRLLTTSEGASRARLTLLDSHDGRFRTLCDEYGLETARIDFTEQHIQIIEDGAGRPLADIDSAPANTAVADAITVAVRALTADPDCALHASIAGGRKTMGFYLGYALSLFGRPQDRLSHVLVSPPFESEPQFFYPPARPRVLTIRGRPVHTGDARVMLAEIPFVRLRHGIDPRLINGAASYSDVVAAAQAALAPPELVLDLHAGQIHAAGRIVKLAPARLALLAVFAHRAVRNAPALTAPIKGVRDADWGARYLEQYRTVRGVMSDTDNTERALREGMDGDYFSSQLSYLRRALRDALGSAAAPYLIDDGGRRPHRYKLALAPEQVRFAALGATLLSPDGRRARLRSYPAPTRDPAARGE